MVEDLPSRQRDVLRLIVQLTEERGFPPTLAELAMAMGLKNRMTVHQHVAALKKKGLVLWEPGLNRSLRVVTAAQEAARGGLKEGLDESEFPDERPARAIPIAGRIAAGRPIDAIETDECLEVESRYGEAGCFALKVKGDSMIEDGIYDGDYVIIKPQPSPNNGDIVVALLGDGTATLKRFYKEKGRFRLQPANAEMEPIYVDGTADLNIQGIVVGLFRKFS